MYHLDNTSGVPEMPEPKDTQTISTRWFGESQEQGGISWPGADWFNIVQAELLAILELAGVNPNKNEYNQIALAINDLSNALKNNLIKPDGLKFIGRCANIDILRQTEPTTDKQKIELIEYRDGYKSITGYFESRSVVDEAEDDGGVNIITREGNLWRRIFGNGVNVAWWGIPENGDVTAAITRSLDYGKTHNVGVIISPGKYLCKTRISVDVGFTSLACLEGFADINFTDSDDEDAVWLYSSAGYPDGMEQNTLNALERIIFRGSRVQGRNGLRLGHEMYDYNGQSSINKCTFIDFDKVVYCTHNTWRTKFSNCTLSSGVSFLFLAPAGLRNSVESITFIDTQISDAKNAPFDVSCENFSLGFYGSSVLNTPLRVSGAGSTVSIEGMGNIENPGRESFLKYAEVTGAGSRLIISKSTIVINKYWLQTSPVFYVGQNSFLIFDTVKFPGNPYVFETNSEDGVRAFVNGPGFVNSVNCTGDIVSGAGMIPLHRSLCPFFNWNFERGTFEGWSLNNSGSVSQTAEVLNIAAKTGNYGLKLTSVAGLNVFATQSTRSLSGRYFTFSVWAKVITPSSSGGNAGNATLTFKSEQGIQLDGSFTANISSGATDWAVYGAYLQGRVPPSAASVEVSLRASNGAVLHFDCVLLNFI